MKFMWIFVSLWTEDKANDINIELFFILHLYKHHSICLYFDCSHWLTMKLWMLQDLTETQ